MRLVIGLCLNIVYLFASLFPRDQSRWVFGAWNGTKFIDNPKYVFLHVLQNLPKVKATWITRNKTLAKELRNKGLPVAYAGSFFWYLGPASRWRSVFHAFGGMGFMGSAFCS